MCDWGECMVTFRPREKKHRFCSPRCRDAWHEVHRPRLASAAVGHPRQGTIKELVRLVLMDGEWHSAYDLSLKVRAGEHSIKARISELRAEGKDIREDLPNGSSRRPHRYRLQVAP